VIDFPPFAGGDQVTESWSAVLDDAVGAFGSAGTVVAVIEPDGEEGAEFPLVFPAITVKV
jgi:hypothetical protein